MSSFIYRFLYLYNFILLPLNLERKFHFNIILHKIAIYLRDNLIIHLIKSATFIFEMQIFLIASI